jgi:hypothetical protein
MCGVSVDTNVVGARAPIIVTEEKQTKVICDLCFGKCVETWIKRKSCHQCAYFSLNEQTQEAHCKKIDLNLELSVRAQIMGSPIPSCLFFDAEKCIHYVNKEEYREKVLRGQIETEKETHYVVCNYCSARYDANQQTACPRCGAIKSG